MMDANVCLRAARGGRLECLKYAHERGCKIQVYACTIAASAGNVECLRYIPSSLLLSSPLSPFPFPSPLSPLFLCCLSSPQSLYYRYTHENGGVMDNTTCEDAALVDSLECLKFVSV